MDVGTISGVNMNSRSTVEEKVLFGKSFRPNQVTSSRADRALRAQIQEPEEEEGQYYSKNEAYVDCQDRDMNQIFNLNGDELIKKKVLYFK